MNKYECVKCKTGEGKKHGLYCAGIYEAIASQQLFYKRTGGGAEYLCKEAIEGTNVGDLKTAIVRLDGGAELL